MDIKEVASNICKYHHKGYWIFGEVRELVEDFLKQKGYKPSRVGGYWQLPGSNQIMLVDDALKHAINSMSN